MDDATRRSLLLGTGAAVAAVQAQARTAPLGPADLSMVEIVEGPVDFVDTRQDTRKGQRWLKPMRAVKAGRPFGRPYPALFNFP